MTILELCRALPDSEPELRARADEFNLAIEQALQVPTRWGARDYVSNIADAKAATDALVVDGWRLKLTTEPNGRVWCGLQKGKPRNSNPLDVDVVASTEPLARSACALLAADVLSA